METEFKVFSEGNLRGVGFLRKLFVTVGTHRQQFNRLLEAVDKLKGNGKLKFGVFAQSGHCTYKPKNFEAGDFLPDEEYFSRLGGCSLVISHAGAGTIINALKHGKPLVIVPRLKKYGEHTNDHQKDIAKAMEEEGRAVAAGDLRELGKKIEEALARPPVKGSGAEGMGKTIAEFLLKQEKMLCRKKF